MVTKAPASDPGGLLDSPVAGRTDRLPISVAPDSYVVPADVVSTLGQGNTRGGAQVLDDLLEKIAGGGTNAGGSGNAVDIVAAGGEYVIPPASVAAIGGGDLKKGHAVLHGMVEKVRRHALKHIAKLPGTKT